MKSLFNMGDNRIIEEEKQKNFKISAGSLKA
jgi:hypothetical protein